MASAQDRVLSNPLRARILDAITASPATRSQIANLVNASFAAVAYHTTVLSNAGCILPAGDESDSGDPLFEATA